MSEFSAAILAGGRATRFGGRDKGSLIVDGRRIVDRQVAELRQVAADLLVVGGTPRPELAGIRHVPDAIPDSGPLGGLHAALSEARGAATVVIACDMPYVTAALLRYLLSLTDAADVVVPRTERGYHPLCAAYTRACLDPIRRRLAARDLRVTGLFDDVAVRVVSREAVAAFGDPEQLLANVNTPEEYRSIEANAS